MARKKNKPLAAPSAPQPTPASESTPKNITEAIFSLFWTPRMRYPFLIIAGLFVIVYALWIAIPADHQKAILSKIIQIPTPSPSPNLPVIILNNYVGGIQGNADNPDFAPVFAQSNGDCTKFTSIPMEPSFNIFPITYEGSTGCFDLPLLRMRKLNGQYPKKSSEMKNGISAFAGEELFGAIWLNNGAAENEELLSKTTAQDVRMSATISEETGPLHTVTVLVTARNAEGVRQEFLVNTGANERLEIIPKSGERFDANFNLIDANFQMGNNILAIGDIKPGFKSASYFRFRVKVVPAA